LSANNSENKKINYKDSGVDIDAGESLVNRIKPFAKKTARPELLGSLGGFGSMFEIPKGYTNPVMVSGTDGVGTKLKLAIELNQHKTIGQDLVGMCVNDILVQGAEPLFFLDYFACGKLNVNQAAEVIEGIARGCELSGCSLAGGETAEMPGMYHDGDYDLAGFAVGIVEKDQIISGNDVIDGDILIGIKSSGPHSNGYSLIRKIIDTYQINLSEELDGKKLSELLMAPTRLYVKSVLELIKTIKIKGMSHITGGGITENLPRSFPANYKAEIASGSWKMANIFEWIKEKANLDYREMYKTFNCGIGFVVIIKPEDLNVALKILKDHGEDVVQIGKISKRASNEDLVIYT
jgi:phosphoribosylformylglycinamidine cyclo-ligase